MINQIFKQLSILIFLVILSSCSTTITSKDLVLLPPSSKEYEEIAANLPSYDSTIGNYVIGSVPKVLAIFVGDSIEINIQVNSVDENERQIWGQVEFKSATNSEWSAISEIVELKTGEKKSVVVSIGEQAVEDSLRGDIRLTVWSSDNVDGPAVSSSPITPLIIWNPEKYYVTLNTIRGKANEQVLTVDRASDECFDRIEADYEKFDDLRESTMSNCIAIFKSALSKYISAFNQSEYEISQLGWPSEIVLEMSNYIKHFSKLIQVVYKNEMYGPCTLYIDLSRSFENAEKCLGVHETFTSGRINKIYNDAEDSKSALAAKLEELGLGNFLREEED